MRLSSFKAIADALNAAGVHYFVVGGLAVNAHGFLRFTKDVDLVIRLVPKDIQAAFHALEGIDYHPSVPIDAAQFSDAELRETWRREKGMLVLKMWSDLHRETPIDIFVYEPFDLDAELQVALRGKFPDDPPALFVSIPTLIRMKQEAGRPQDLIDIENLNRLLSLQTQDRHPSPPTAT